MMVDVDPGPGGCGLCQNGRSGEAGGAEAERSDAAGEEASAPGVGLLGLSPRWTAGAVGKELASAWRRAHRFLPADASLGLSRGPSWPAPGIAVKARARARRQ